MTLIEITNRLKHYAENQFNNPVVKVGSLYENMNTKELKYPCINFDVANTVKRDNEVIYSFYVYYVDRLNEDGSNLLEIQSQADTSLQLLLHDIMDHNIMTLDEYTNAIITPFKLKFADVCAGAWLQINVHTTNGIDYCGDGSQNILYITANGEYDTEFYNRVNVNVPQYLTSQNYFYFKSRENDSKIGFHLADEDPFEINFEYSRDKIEWTEWDFSPLIVNSGDTIFFRGTNPNGFKPNPAMGPEYYFRTPSGSFNIGGDIRTLLAKAELPNIPPTYGFRYLFNNCKIVETHPKLLSGFEELNDGCFSMLFYRCVFLTKAPELPYMTLRPECYMQMFSECSSLTKAPVLPATTLKYQCYEYMFFYCSSLNYVKCLAKTNLNYARHLLSGTNQTGVFVKDYTANWSEVPDAIPSGWTIKDNEIELIEISITENGTYTADLGTGYKIVKVNVAPIIIGDYFYIRSREDGNRVSFNAPLSAETINLEYSTDKIEWTEWDFSEFTLDSGKTVYFRGNNPNGLPNVSNYYCRFVTNKFFDIGGDIRSLLDKTMSITAIPSKPYCFTGLFSKSYLVNVDPNLLVGFKTLYSSCFYYMFNECRYLLNAPNLPFDLAPRCYYRMFRGCTSLTTAPDLLSTESLSDLEYCEMFDGCTSLQYVKCLATGNLWNARDILKNVAETGVFIKNASADWSNVQNGIPSDWKILEPALTATTENQ